MKNYLKILLLSLFLSTSTIVSFSQSTDQVSYLQIGKIGYKGKITWGEMTETDLVFTLDGKHIYIDDKANTHLYCYKMINEDEGYNNEGDAYKSYTWDAYDEKSRKCNFSMIYFRDKKLTIYGIVYSDYAFRYYIYNSNLSNYKL